MSFRIDPLHFSYGIMMLIKYNKEEIFVFLSSYRYIINVRDMHYNVKYYLSIVGECFKKYKMESPLPLY